MPLDVPPRTSRFGSSLVLSRVHLVRPDFVEQGLRFWYTKGNASSRLTAQVLSPSPNFATAVVGRIKQRRRNRVLFAVLGLDRVSSFSGWFSVTGIIHHWPVNAA